MKSNLFLVAISAILLQATFVYSQSDHATNISGSTSSAFEPLGWKSGSDNSVDIVNYFPNQNVYIWTNDGTTTSIGSQKVTIVGSSGATDGFVGIGVLAPQNLVHLYDANGLPVYCSITN